MQYLIMINLIHFSKNWLFLFRSKWPQPSLFYYYIFNIQISANPSAPNPSGPDQVFFGQDTTAAVWMGEDGTRYSTDSGEDEVVYGELDGIVCKYSCTPGGGCKTERDGGGWLGSCYPWAFRGGCSGIPTGCKECNIDDVLGHTCPA